MDFYIATSGVDADLMDELKNKRNVLVVSQKEDWVTFANRKDNVTLVKDFPDYTTHVEDADVVVWGADELSGYDDQLDGNIFIRILKLVEKYGKENIDWYGNVVETSQKEMEHVVRLVILELTKKIDVKESVDVKQVKKELWEELNHLSGVTEYLFEMAVDFTVTMLDKTSYFNLDEKNELNEVNLEGFTDWWVEESHKRAAKLTGLKLEEIFSRKNYIHGEILEDESKEVVKTIVWIEKMLDKDKEESFDGKQIVVTFNWKDEKEIGASTENLLDQLEESGVGSIVDFKLSGFAEEGMESEDRGRYEDAVVFVKGRDYDEDEVVTTIVNTGLEVLQIETADVVVSIRDGGKTEQYELRVG